MIADCGNLAHAPAGSRFAIKKSAAAKTSAVTACIYYGPELHVNVSRLGTLPFSRYTRMETDILGINSQCAHLSALRWGQFNARESLARETRFSDLFADSKRRTGIVSMIP